MKPKFPFHQVDVFCSDKETAYLGNPVAVITIPSGHVVSDADMQKFACWANLSETTFLLPPTHPDADYQLRIFTKSRELPFAGHPTLGSCHAWLESGGQPKNNDVIVQQCAKGLIKIRRNCREGTLAFEAPPLNRSGPLSLTELDTVVKALRLNASDVVAHSWCANGPSWMGLLLPSATRVLSIRPDYGLLGHMDVGVIGPIGKGDDDDNHDGFDFEVRAFVSLDEGGEDPVCGSLNASLAQWLIGSGRAPASGYVARQGTVLGRKGRVSASVDASSASSSPVVWIGGMCITCIKGEVQI